MNSELTISEILILNCIIYANEFCIPEKIKRYIGKSILDWAMNFKYELYFDGSMPGEITEEEFENIIYTIKKNEDVYSNIKMLNVENFVSGNIDGTDNIVNCTFSYFDNLYIVFKGTSGSLEWADNVTGAYFGVTDTIQQKDALKYYDKIYDEYGKSYNKIFVSGHSKGGNKAKYVCVLRGKDDKIIKCYSFDGQGFNQAFLEKYDENIKINSKKIYSISNEYDFVNIILFSIAESRIYIKSNYISADTFNVKDQIIHKYRGIHSPYTMLKVDGDGLVINDTTEQSDLMKTMDALLDYLSLNLSEDDNNFIYYNLASYISRDKLTSHGLDHRESPDGFYKRIFNLIHEFEKDSKNIGFIDIIGMMKPFFAEIGSEIIMKRFNLKNSDYSLVSVNCAKTGEKISFLDKIKINLDNMTWDSIDKIKIRRDLKKFKNTNFKRIKIKGDNIVQINKSILEKAFSKAKEQIFDVKDVIKEKLLK